MQNRVFFIAFLCFLMGFSSVAQTRKQLEKQRKELQKEITKVNQLLFKTKKEKSNALDDLSNLKKRISVRERLIKTINLEARVLGVEIKKNEKEIVKLNKKLDYLKTDYAKMIYESYKSKSQQSRLMFLLSSQSFFQAYKRYQYMRQYTAFRKKQGEQVILKTSLIQKLNDTLIEKKRVKDKLVLSEKEQNKEIQTEKKEQERLVSVIKKKERKYRRDLKKKIRRERKLARRIDNFIKNAIVKSNAKRKKGTKKSTGFILTPAAKALADKFEQNRGKLPWPLDKALITRRFGKQKHPTISGITINSSGLHMATEKGAEAKAIFNGEVFAILVQSEGRKSVMVKHGNYISAYNNLENIYVKKGDEVSIGEKLGKVFTNKSSGKTNLVFVLFKNARRLNPSRWILKR